MQNRNNLFVRRFLVLYLVHILDIQYENRHIKSNVLLKEKKINKTARLFINLSVANISCNRL